MFLKKKRSDTLPDLPQLESPFPEKFESEEEDEDELERHALPTFPDAPNHEGFTQSAIKDAMNIEDETPELPELPEYNSHDDNLQTQEMEEWSPQEPRAFRPPEIKESIQRIEIQEPEQVIPPLPHKMEPPRTITLPLNERKSDIFVKINKFNSAKKSLAEIANKIEEIDETLRKIKETKMREEQELSSWEKEIALVKAHIKNVEENIFEKLE